jgi:hypothetical protein
VKHLISTQTYFKIMEIERSERSPLFLFVLVESLDALLQEYSSLSLQPKQEEYEER